MPSFAGGCAKADEIAFYLDAAAVFFGLMAVVVFIGAGLLNDGQSVSLLAHGAFFLGILAVTLLLLLATHAPLAVRRGVGDARRRVVRRGRLHRAADRDRAAVADRGLHLAVAFGALLAGHGGGLWTDLEDHSPRYVKRADAIRAALPISAALLTLAVATLLILRPELIDGLARIGVAIAAGTVAVAVLARQTLLLVDRERVIGSERRLSDELIVAEAQYRSVVERVPGIVYVAEAGQHGRWHFVSPKIKELLGYTAEEWMRDPTLWISRMHPADRDRMIQAETDDLERTDPQGRWNTD